MGYGFSGKVLHVDLSHGQLRVEEFDEAFWRSYMGGWNLILHYLLRETPPGVDPLGPENLLVFAPGVLTGSPFPGSGRNAVGCKSPLTNAFGVAEAGGYFGAELKHAGWDGIVFSGRAPYPQYLAIRDDGVELRDATHLWGLDTLEAQLQMRAELGEKLARTALIGPAGERLVRYAAIAHDLTHFAGRTGVGAVMGSKQLKGIVVKGTGKSTLADPAAVQALAKWLASRVKELSFGLNAYGTGYNQTGHLQSGNLPTRNFRDGNFFHAEDLSSPTMKKTILQRMESCYACSVRCKKVVQTTEPYVSLPEYGGPEYEAIAALGSDCGVDDLMAVVKANELCNRYGMDVISAGASVAFAMECFEYGLLTPADTGGIDLRWGNAPVLVQMMELIARRQGIGDLLAEGTRLAAQRIGRGAEGLAVHVKGLEVPMQEPRLKRALGLGYAVSPTGADHNHNVQDVGFDVPGRTLDGVRCFGITEPIPLPDLGPRKVKLLRAVTLCDAALNCMVLCKFVPWTYEQKVDLVRAVTGWDMSLAEISEVGERAWNLARLYNLREGLKAEDDWLPQRFFRPATIGPLSDTALDPAQMREAIAIYYTMLGWDPQTGEPTTERLKALGIEWASPTGSRG